MKRFTLPLLLLAPFAAGLLHAQLAQRVRQAPDPAPVRTTIRVPGDVATLQRAIQLSSENGVILVSGDQDPVVVDRPLSILGDPHFRITMGYLYGYPCSGAGLDLQGPGHGVLTVAGLETRGYGDCAHVAPGIEGGGFDELRVLDSELYVALAGLTGSGYGASAIAIDDIPLVLVSDTFARGGQDDNDSCHGFLIGDGYPGLDAPNSTVVVLDSTLEGGHGGYLCCEPPWCFECPPSIVGRGGVGGDALVAAEAFVSNSSLVGGRGSTFTVYVWPDVFECGKQPDGVPMVVGASYELIDELHGSSRMSLGLQYTLSWSVDGPTISLWFAEDFGAPTAMSGEYWSFLPAESTVWLGTLPSQPESWTFQVPPWFGWMGRQLTFQGMSASGTVTRPVTAVVTN